MLPPRRNDTVVIVTGGHLCHNPRVIKEATALARAGYDVRILGTWSDPELKARDERMLATLPVTFTAVIDVASPRLRSRARSILLRARAKSARALSRWTGRRSDLQLGPATCALAQAASAIDASLFIAHLEPALPAAVALLQSGKRVGIDMEDWYSEDLLPEARRHRPIPLLQNLERRLLQQCAYATCPSYAMSKALSDVYRCDPPAVIYNAFHFSHRQSLDHLQNDRRTRETPSIHWYSQTIGPGRGLEDLFAALPHLRRQVQIHLRGNPVAGFDSWLTASVPERFRDCVFLHPLVPNDQLLSRIAEHDIGFAGEMKFCRSRDLTVTNKMMEYLLAGLAVVASDTAGQTEIAERASDAILLYASGEPLSLASSLNVFLELPERLQQAKAAALQAAERTFCWERQEPIFLDLISRALDRSAA